MNKDVFKKFSIALGIWSLYSREVLRFLNLTMQTIVGPLFTTILFITLFSIIGPRSFSAGTLSEIPFILFIIPGLIMTSTLQNSFANTGISLIQYKIFGNLIDIIMSPLSINGFLIAFAAAGTTRGFCVFFSSLLAVFCLSWLGKIPPIYVEYPFFLIIFIFLGALMMALLGILVGIWADRFNNYSFAFNFFIMPLTFLSGTFYSITKLPEYIQKIAFLNPFFHIINGIRYSFIKHSDMGNILVSMFFILTIIILLYIICYIILNKGYKLKK